MSVPYDFNKREDYDYSYSFDYLSGVGLGKDQVRAEQDRAKKLGTYDMTPVEPPTNESVKNEIIHVANSISKSKQRDSMLKKIGEIKDRRTEFVWNTNHIHHPYFEWALHCIDRQVPNWTSITPSMIPSSQPSTSSKEPVVVGDWVEIDGVAARPELNGKGGMVIGTLPNERLKVEFPDVAQTVSLSAGKCCKSARTGVKPSAGGQLPQALKIEVMNLQSDQGKLLNGSVGYILGYSKESGRYTVRLEEKGGTKSIKKENLHVCLPPGWEEQVDPSSGNRFYRETASGKVTWDHPILGKRKEAEKSGFEEEDEDNDHDESEEFNREEFLEQESKRIRLDKERAAASRFQE